MLHACLHSSTSVFVGVSEFVISSLLSSMMLFSILLVDFPHPARRNIADTRAIMLRCFFMLFLSDNKTISACYVFYSDMQDSFFLHIFVGIFIAIAIGNILNYILL